MNTNVRDLQSRGGDTSAPNTLADLLERAKPAIAQALPEHMSPERLLRTTTTLVKTTPMLGKCHPPTVVGALLQAASMGLEPTSGLGHCYLVPFKNRKKGGRYEAQLIVGYKGLIDLARRSGHVSTIECHLVYERDKFDLELGIESHVTHKPYLDGDRGQLRLVYAVAKFSDGGYQFDWMTIDQVNKIRARSKSSDKGPWVTDYEQMVRKTMIRRLANYLPLSAEYVRAASLSEMAERGQSQADALESAIEGDFEVVAPNTSEDDDGADNNDSTRPESHEQQQRRPEAPQQSSDMEVE